MKFRKPTQKDYDGEGDSMLCWRWWIFEIWHDLNFSHYEFIMRLSTAKWLELYYKFKYRNDK